MIIWKICRFFIFDAYYLRYLLARNIIISEFYILIRKSKFRTHRWNVNERADSALWLKGELRKFEYFCEVQFTVQLIFLEMMYWIIELLLVTGVLPCDLRFVLNISFTAARV